MTPDALKLYKLIILYFLSKAGQPVPNAIISDFILDNNYTDYFSIQQTLSALSEDGMIKANHTRSAAYYEITPSGEETLEFFCGQLPNGTKRQIEDYFRKNKISMADSMAVRTDFKKLKANEYLATCSIIERGSTVMEVSLNLPSEEAAIGACKRFKEKKQEIYSMLFKSLAAD